MKLCECGCGQIIGSGKRFVRGHNGKCRSSESLERIKKSVRDRWADPIYKEKISMKLRRPHSEEHNRKVSEARKGITFSKEHLRKLSESHKGKCNPESTTEEVNKKRSVTVKKQWSNKEYKDKRLKLFFHKMKMVPNNQELCLDSVIQSVSKEYKYSGDGKIIIGGKCPDWFNINGKKQVIEFFGDYWHGKPRTGRSKEEEEELRKSHFRNYGFETLVIWGFELENRTKLIEKIKSFTGGN